MAKKKAKKVDLNRATKACPKQPSADVTYHFSRSMGHFIAVNYSILTKIMFVVLAVSAVMGYRGATSIYLPVKLFESGYSAAEIATIIVQRMIIGMFVDWGIIAIVVVTNYYLGKQYKLRKKSTAVFLLALIVAIVIGNLIGYGIGQLQFPEFPIFLTFLFQIPFLLTTPIMWSFIGMLAGNYKRELEKARARGILTKDFDS